MLAYGQRVKVLGYAADPMLRRPESLAVLGPRLFGVDEDFRPIEALIWPSRFSLAGGAVRPVTVVVPFAGATPRKVRVCAESVPFPTQGAQIKTQICGRFLGQRLQ